jgi:hypothetical protein
MKTVKKIEDLLLVNQLFTGRYDRLWKELEGHRIAEQADARGVERDGCRMDGMRAEAIWDWLDRNQRAGTLRRWT